MMNVTWTGQKHLTRTMETLRMSVQKRVAKKTVQAGGKVMSRALKKAAPKKIDPADAMEMSGLYKTSSYERFAERLAAITEDSKTVERGIARLVRNGIGRRYRFYKESDTAMEAVGPRYNFKLPGIVSPAGYVAQMIEYGDENRPPQPFLRRAARGAAQETMEAMARAMHDGIIAEARKARRG